MTTPLITKKFVSCVFAPPFVFPPQFLASRPVRRGEQTSASPHKKSRSPIWCVFTVWLELILSEIPERNQTKEAAPPPLANARQPAKKFSLHF